MTLGLSSIIENNKKQDLFLYFIKVSLYEFLLKINVTVTNGIYNTGQL